MPSLKDIAYNCRQATYLIEKKQFGPITLKEQLQLRYHLTGCSICRLYQQQSIYISEVLQNHYTHFALSPLALDDHFKEDLQKQINIMWKNKK